MNKLRPGDRIDCCIKNYSIISPYDADYDEIRTFEIIAQDKSGFYIYVPPYTVLKGSSKVGLHSCKQLNINPKFLGTDFIYINSGYIYKINAVMDGATCIQCHEFYYQASANQLDGTFKCWCCRSDPYR